MKKIAVVVLIMMLVFSGCSEITDTLKETVGDLGNTISEAVDTSISEEEMYSELNRLIKNTDASTKLTGDFTFVAILYDEAEEIEFEEEDEAPGMYHSAGISRNWDDYFLLDVTNIDGDFHSGDIVKITGQTDGTIYWTEDNKQIEVLAIKASKMEKYEPEEVEEVVSFEIDIDGNTIEFIGAHKTKDTFGEAIVVYFNFKNNGSNDATPNFSDFYVEYGGEETDRTIFSIDEVDGSALEMKSGITTKTYAGKTQTYYIVYKGNAEVDADEPIYFSLYDDEFRRTYDCGLEIAESLEALKA